MNYLKTTVLLLLMVCIAPEGHGSDVAIGLYRDMEIRSVVFSTVEGEYMLTADGRQVAVLRKGDILHLEINGSGIEVHDTSRSFGVFRNLEFKGISGISVFLVKPVYPAAKGKESDDALSVSSFNESLLLINRLGLEKYIPGVVETEGGSGAEPEYYKAQAVISRTFAIKNFHRHAHEGFNLCDGVHCQAYNGKSRMNARIYDAAEATQGEILADQNREPVVAVYHASCGGITGSAAVEWNRDLPYLIPVEDPFCSKSDHRNWSRTIPVAEWNACLEQMGYFGGSERLFSMEETGRRKFLDQDNSKLPLTEIRADLRLKSSYFHVEPGNGSVILIGHGYGHGLGLCQEGAMEMARVGYTYVDILMFYYTGVRIVRKISSETSFPAP